MGSDVLIYFGLLKLRKWKDGWSMMMILMRPVIKEMEFPKYRQNKIYTSFPQTIHNFQAASFHFFSIITSILEVFWKSLDAKTTRTRSIGRRSPTIPR
jgi:hypothetical protein